MKATGIVRRIEEYGIIGQKLKKRINTGFLAVFIQHVEPSPVLCVVCWIHIIAHKRSTANTVLLFLNT